MNNFKIINKLIFSLTYFFIATAFINGQNVEKTTNTSKSQMLTKVIKKEGWQIPSENTLGLLTENSFNFNGLIISVKSYDNFKTNIKLMLDDYWLTADNKLIVANNKVRIDKITIYYIYKKPFAADISYNPAPDAPSGTLESYRSGIIFRYICDEDGDGIMETRYAPYKEIKLPTDYPNWVKEKIKEKEKQKAPKS